MEDNKAAPSAPPQGGGASRRPLGVLVVFHLVRISYVFASFPEPVLAPGIIFSPAGIIFLIRLGENFGSQGPKGAIGPLKKVASLRETARLVNPKIAQTLPKVCQKLTKSLPK